MHSLDSIGCFSCALQNRKHSIDFFTVSALFIRKQTVTSVPATSKISRGSCLCRAAFTFHYRKLYCYIMTWPQHQMCSPLSCVRFFFILCMRLCGSCPLAGLSMQVHRSFATVWMNLAHAEPASHRIPLFIICHLLSTSLIFICTLFRLSSSPDQTQATDSCLSLSVQGQTLFVHRFALEENPLVCLYIHGLHFPLIGNFCEICSFYWRQIWPKTFDHHENQKTAESHF